MYSTMHWCLVVTGATLQGCLLKYKPANTERYFHIFLTDEEAQRLEDLGWNVKRTKHENPSEPQQAYLQVFIKLDVSPRLQPRIWQTRKKGRPILMDADLINQLDSDDIERCKILDQALRLDSGNW